MIFWEYFAFLLVVVSTSGFAVLVEHKGASDQKSPDRERNQLAELRALHRTLPAVRAGAEGPREELGQADEDEGARAQQDDDGDLSVAERAGEGEDDDHPEDGAQREHEVVGERLGGGRERERKRLVRRGWLGVSARGLIIALACEGSWFVASGSSSLGQGESGQKNPGKIGGESQHAARQIPVTGVSSSPTVSGGEITTLLQPPTTNETWSTHDQQIKKATKTHLLDAHATVQERHEVGDLVGDLVHDGGVAAADGVAAAEEGPADYESVSEVMHLAFGYPSETSPWEQSASRFEGLFHRLDVECRRLMLCRLLFV